MLLLFFLLSYTFPLFYSLFSYPLSLLPSSLLFSLLLIPQSWLSVSSSPRFVFTLTLEAFDEWRKILHMVFFSWICFFLVFYNYTCLPICQALVMTPITTGNHPESGRFIPPHGAINRLKLSRVLQYCSWTYYPLRHGWFRLWIKFEEQLIGPWYGVSSIHHWVSGSCPVQTVLQKKKKKITSQPQTVWKGWMQPPWRLTLVCGLQFWSLKFSATPVASLASLKLAWAIFQQYLVSCQQM